VRQLYLHFREELLTGMALLGANRLSDLSQEFLVRG
jgi:isopentenyl diphosphate isomerase/L-lactate dehydrogenase-like FMN-dependent dehydrogenase